MKVIVIVLSFLFSATLFSQNNVEKYSKIINKAELNICDSNYHKSICQYEKAFTYVDCPFSMDVFNYFQLLMIIDEDSEKINNSLMILASRGHKMSVYENYFGKRKTEYPGFAKIDTNIFNM